MCNGLQNVLVTKIDTICSVSPHPWLVTAYSAVAGTLEHFVDVHHVPTSAVHSFPNAHLLTPSTNQKMTSLKTTMHWWTEKNRGCLRHLHLQDKFGSPNVGSKIIGRTDRYELSPSTSWAVSGAESPLSSAQPLIATMLLKRKSSCASNRRETLSCRLFPRQIKMNLFKIRLVCSKDWHTNWSFLCGA